MGIWKEHESKAKAHAFNIKVLVLVLIHFISSMPIVSVENDFKKISYNFEIAHFYIALKQKLSIFHVNRVSINSKLRIYSA